MPDDHTHRAAPPVPEIASLRPVADASAWRGADLATRTDWIHHLTPAEIADLATALAGVQARGLATTAITATIFVFIVAIPLDL